MAHEIRPPDTVPFSGLLNVRGLNPAPQEATAFAFQWFESRHLILPRLSELPLDMPNSAMPSTAMLSKELVAASTVPLVLSVLTEGESYGYALIQRVQQLSDGQIQWTEGMLYPVLHWMEREGLIESEWRVGDSARKRKYYRLRSKGRSVLNEERRQWLTVHQTLTKLWPQPRLT